MSSGSAGDSTVEGDTSGAGSKSETETTDLRWEECFATAIHYFHEQIDQPIQAHTEDGEHPNRASTAREYFHGRGWSDETIENRHLGWASPDSHRLGEYLMEQDYTSEELLATGLFNEDLTSRWSGRYVLPYHDDGQPVYAVSRSTESDDSGAEGSGGHPDDGLSQKYDRPRHSEEYIRISEPLFGSDSVCPNEPIIITEGIADAITVQQNGHPCVSPVTTQLNEDDQNELLSLIEDHDVPTVYVIQDSEPPSVSVDENSERLDLQQFGPGLRGAIDTAIFLTENGIDARVNTPPRIGQKKVDVDDYLRYGWGSMDVLARSAKPPQQHAAHTAPEHGSKSASSAISQESPTVSGTDEQSGLFALGITDVTGLSRDYRGTNPLGHTGDSENYFVVSENEGAYDHKRKEWYNPLTYILCDAGERPVTDPGGSLSNREMFVAWKHAKQNGLLSTDDPIPHDGLIHVANENGLCTQDEIRDGWKVPLKAYNKALDVVRDEYGLEPGRDPYNATSTSEKVRQTPVVAENEPDSATMTVTEAQDRCQKTINNALAQSQHSLIDALPGQGKSRGVIEWAAKTDMPVTVLAPRRELLSEEYAEWCDELGLEYRIAPAFHRDCTCANGEEGKYWERQVKQLYDQGVTAGEIHGLDEVKFDRQLPCQQDGECPYLKKQDFEPTDYDVLLGHYSHAYQDELVEGRVVVIDETPTDAFIEEFNHSEVDSAVTHYLHQHDEIPFDSYTDLTTNRTDSHRKADALKQFEEKDREARRDGRPVMIRHSIENNAYAPLMTYALLASAELDNGWEHTNLPDGQVCVRNGDPSEEHGESELSVLKPPTLTDAERVIALDGTPLPEQWERCLGISLSHYPVLDDEERVTYLQDTLDLTIFQMSQAAKSYSSGTWVKEKQLKDDAALFEYVGAREGQLPDLISSQKAIKKYSRENILEQINEVKHYGDFTGSNMFKHSRVGIVAGSPHYGDTYIEKWGALAGKSVERLSDDGGMNLDYGSFGNEILRDMRENEVLQAVLRFGRDGDGTVVYVATAALPEWVPIANTGEVHVWSDGMHQLVGELRDREDDEWRTDDLIVNKDGSSVLDTDAAEPISRRQVRRHLKMLANLGYLNKRKESCGWVWTDPSLATITDEREVIFRV